MHASTSQLLNFRDGAPVDTSVAAHVSGCEQCIAEVAKLAQLRDRLRGLPALPRNAMHCDMAKADALWEGVQRALQPVPRTVSANRYLALAAAAVWAVVALVWFVFADHGMPGQARPVMIVREVPAADLEMLVAQSQTLERVLFELPQRPRMEQAATAATLDALEERIQWLDYTLSRTAENGIPVEQTQMLWQERVELLDSLVTLRYVQAGRVYY